MKTKVTLALLTFGLALPAYASFYSGNKLAELAQAYDSWNENSSNAVFRQSTQFLSYVAGVHDTLAGFLICSPAEATAGQMASIVSKFLKEHPERWAEPASVLASNAMARAFPCKK